MANNYTTSSNLTSVNYSSGNEQAWMVPTDSTCTPDRTILVSNNDGEVQNNISVIDIDDSPPNYFDISIVPNGAILYNDQSTPCTTEVSKAEIKRDTKSVSSRDSLIDRNPDQLWLYFMTYLKEKPRLTVCIHGFHKTTLRDGTIYKDRNGNPHSAVPNQSYEVTDFRFFIDLAPYISEQWWRVAVIPSERITNTDEVVTLRDVLEQYTLSGHKFKSIQLKKQFYGWNLVELQTKLIRLIRSTGYSKDISVKFDMFDNLIVANSPSILDRFADSGLVWCFCCLSCLCIIFCPILCCLKLWGSTRDNVAADYMMIKSSDIFLELNSQMITNAISTHSFETYVARVA